MSNIGAEDISEKMKRLLDELSALEVHAIILASYAKQQDRSTVFGMEMNTTQTIAAALLQAGSKRVAEMREVESPRRRPAVQ